MNKLKYYSAGIVQIIIHIRWN